MFSAGLVHHARAEDRAIPGLHPACDVGGPKHFPETRRCGVLRPAPGQFADPTCEGCRLHGLGRLLPVDRLVRLHSGWCHRHRAGRRHVRRGEGVREHHPGRRGWRHRQLPVPGPPPLDPLATAAHQRGGLGARDPQRPRLRDGRVHLVRQRLLVPHRGDRRGGRARRQGRHRHGPDRRRRLGRLHPRRGGLGRHPRHRPLGRALALHGGPQPRTRRCLLRPGQRGGLRRLALAVGPALRMRRHRGVVRHHDVHRCGGAEPDPEAPLPPRPLDGVVRPGRARAWDGEREPQLQDGDDEPGGEAGPEPRAAGRRE
mmetsp:Transcript_29322/g.87195  ORF Transcript_29322/g.87195 Transcript_29322/m.87195 type:complete len:314 (+) Transcript_29322:82-1023(+)